MEGRHTAPPPPTDVRVRMLESPVVRSMLSTARAALVRQALSFPEDTPKVLILVEIYAKESGISVNHNMEHYDRCYRRLVEAVGQRIVSPEPGSDAAITAMVTLAPQPDKASLQRGNMSSASSRALGLPDNVAHAHAAESRLGAFEVALVTNLPADGAVHVPRVAGLHSKLHTRRFPNVRRLVSACQELLLPAFRRVDGDLALTRVLNADQVEAPVLRDVLAAYLPYASPGIGNQASARMLAIEEADAELRAAIGAVEQARGHDPDIEVANDEAGAAAALDLLRQALDRSHDQASPSVVSSAEAALLR